MTNFRPGFQKHSSSILRKKKLETRVSENSCSNFRKKPKELHPINIINMVNYSTDPSIVSLPVIYRNSHSKIIESI